MDLLKHVYYINLAERTDRLEHLQKEFAKLGIEGERVNAVKTRVGAIGCTMSHIKCLEMAKEKGYPYVMICEDDITFTNPALFLENLQHFADSRFSFQFDVVILGGNNCPPYARVSEFCIQVSNCQTTTGYIVRQHYYDTLITNFRESVQKLLSDPENKREYALDIYWKRLQQNGKWYMIIPPTVIQYGDYSDIEERVVNYENLMKDLDKQWLFKMKPPPPSVLYSPYQMNLSKKS